MNYILFWSLTSTAKAPLITLTLTLTLTITLTLRTLDFRLNPRGYVGDEEFLS